MPADLTLLTTWLQGHTDRDDEARVLDLLREASAAHLDEILCTIDCAELFSSLDDHLLGPRHRTALRELLTARLGELSIRAQANLAYGLQARHTDRADEEAIKAVFLARSGPELTHLKNQMNSRTDAHDLEGLVFDDVDDEGIRREILDHIAREASTVELTEPKVLCDIDDTVVCALHDRRYPRGTIYPGMLALLDALDRGASDEPFSTGDLTFVTARPGDAFGLIENHTRASLTRAGIANHSVLTGTLAALVTHDLMAGQKIANIDHYHQLFPEYRLLFIGDSGQGDIEVGRRMLAQFTDYVDIVMIHDVVGTSPEERAALEAEGIHLVDTYIDAARHALEIELISEAGLQRVIDESFAALAAIDWDSPEQEADVRALLERDSTARSAHVAADPHPPVSHPVLP